MNKDYYAILGLQRDASPEDIKKAYRNLSKKHHPDLGGDAEKFKEINEAYHVLSDPEKRQSYDNPGGGPAWFNFDEMFGARFRQQRHDPLAPRKGQNVVLEHEVSLHLFILGGKFKVKINLQDFCEECNGVGFMEFDSCSTCNGTGQITEVKTGQGMYIRSSRACPNCQGKGKSSTADCIKCRGTGRASSERDLELDIPAGSKDGAIVVAQGQGGKGFNGGPAGDLIVKIYMRMPNSSDLTEEQKELLRSI